MVDGGTDEVVVGGIEVEVVLVELVDVDGDEVGVVVVEVGVVVFEVGVVVVEVVVDEVVDVVVGGPPGPPSHAGSTAPGEKLTPGPDLGGGMSVGTVSSRVPRYQVVANGSAPEGVVEDVVVVASVDEPDGATAPATVRRPVWAPTSAPTAVTTAIPSLSFLMILGPGYPRPV